MTDDHSQLPDPDPDMGTAGGTADDQTVRVPSANPEAPNPSEPTGADTVAAAEPRETVASPKTDPEPTAETTSETSPEPADADHADIDVPTVPNRVAKPKPPTAPASDRIRTHGRLFRV